MNPQITFCTALTLYIAALLQQTYMLCTTHNARTKGIMIKIFTSTNMHGYEGQIYLCYTLGCINLIKAYKNLCVLNPSSATNTSVSAYLRVCALLICQLLSKRLLTLIAEHHFGFCFIRMGMIEMTLFSSRIRFWLWYDENKFIIAWRMAS